MAEKVEAEDCSKIKADEQHSRDRDVAVEEGKEPCSSEQEAERGVAPIAEEVGKIRLEGTRLLSVIPVKIKGRKSPDSFGSCSPFSPTPLGDGEPTPFLVSPIKDATAPVGGPSSDLASAKDKQLAVSQETKSSDSFAVLKDGNGGNIVKEEKEIATVGETSNEASGTSKPRKKKTGVSALTYALQMEAAKKDVAQEATESASGSGLQNDTGDGGNTSVKQLKKTRPRPEDLPWIPVRKWGPDGRPIVEESNQDSEFRADELVTPFRFVVGPDGRVRMFFEVPSYSDDEEKDPPLNYNLDEVEQPNIWQRCFLWCGRILCCREYEQL